MTRACSMLTHSIWKTISPSGTCVNQSVKCQMHARCSTHTHTNIHIHDPWQSHSQQQTHTHPHKGRESELGSKSRLVFLVRHLLGPRDRWWANQTAWCLCYSPPLVPSCCPSPKPASWLTWQVAPCECDTATALENYLCIHFIETDMQISKKWNIQIQLTLPLSHGSRPTLHTELIVSRCTSTNRNLSFICPDFFHSILTS